MSITFPPTDRQPQASVGKPSQVGFPFMGLVPGAHRLDAPVVAAASFNGCLTAAAQACGKEDQQIADEIHICHGYMSRFMRGVGQQWAKRLIAFMRSTNSLAPLQWIADQMGCEVVIKDMRAAEVAALRSRLNELEHAA